MLIDLLTGNIDKWSLISLLLSLPCVILALTVHECAHGYAAYKLGDPTARNFGRLTLNPLKHLDPFGFVAMVLFGFGWANPVPIRAGRFKNPRRGMAITALAGPACNIVLACIALVLYGALFYPIVQNITLIGEIVLRILSTISYLSVALAIFNLLPISPLDGSKILYSFLPDNVYRKILRYERYGMLVLFGLIMLMRRTGVNPLGSITEAVYDFLFNIAAFMSQLILKTM